MAVSMNIAQAKARLSELIARAERGEEVVLTRAGKPVVTLARVPVPEPDTRTPGQRLMGAWAHLGELKDPYLFHGPDPDTEEMLRKWDAEMDAAEEAARNRGG